MNAAMPAKDQPSQRGFTLIELLVSLAILSLTATLLLAGMVGAGAVARRTMQHEIAGAQVAAAQTILRERIEQLRPVRRIDLSDPLMDIRGDDRLFEFYGPSPIGDGPGTFQRYRLMVTAPGELVLYRTGERNDRLDVHASSVVGWSGATLLTGVASLAIGYFGAAPPDYQLKWRSFWQDNSQAPGLVRIRIGFADGDPRSWPDLVVHPGATIDLACDPEARTPRCVDRG